MYISFVGAREPDPFIELPRTSSFTPVTEPVLSVTHCRSGRLTAPESRMGNLLPILSYWRERDRLHFNSNHITRKQAHTAK